MRQKGFLALLLGFAWVWTGCSGEVTGGGSSDGFCLGTEAAACTTDTDCAVGTRCFEGAFCAVICTSSDQCGGMACVLDAPGPAEPDANPAPDPNNTPPQAVDDNFTIPTGENAELDVLGNDSDPDGDEIEILSVAQPAHGTVVAVKGRLEFTSAMDGFLGMDTFTYTISDGRGGESTATVNLTIAEPPPDPVLIITAPEGGNVFEAGAGVEITFEVEGCNFVGPSQDNSGCHGHKFVDGERWTDAEGMNHGHYDTGPFSITGLEPGEHTFTFALAVNDGSDQLWEPQITAEVTFEIVAPVEEPVAFDGTISDLLVQDDGASLQIGASTGLFDIALTARTLAPLLEGPEVTALIQDPADDQKLWASGRYDAGGYPLWGFVESRDGGDTWTEISLTNEVAFDHLAASGSTIAGIGGEALYASNDSGRTWQQHPWTDAVAGVAIASTQGPVVLVASSAGIGGVALPDLAPQTIVEADVSFLQALGEGFVYGTADGQLFFCNADFSTCNEASGPGEPIVGFARDESAPGTYFVLTADSAIHRTRDDTQSWDAIVVPL